MTFHVIDKRTGKEPIFDHNHIFREKWFKESGLIWCDIDGWYISEDGTLVLVDDCGKVAYPPPDRFEVVYDETVTEFADRCRECGMMQGKRLKQMRQEIEQIPDHTMVSERSMQVFTGERMKKEILKVLDRYTKGEKGC